MWRTDTMLTDLLSFFRNLKSELGLRPVVLLKEERSDERLFINLLAYKCVQAIRLNL